MPNGQQPGGPGTGAPTASAIIDALAAGTEAQVTFGTIVAMAGARVHGLALLVLVLPEIPPLPLPSASTILGIPLLVVSVHLALFGEDGFLPSRLRTVGIPRGVIRAAARYLAPTLRWIERASRPRLPWLARRERLVGIVCVYLSLVLLLPIPFLNAPPAACLALVALGMILRDGLFILLGILGAAAITGVLVGVIDAAGLLLR